MGCATSTQKDTTTVNKRQIHRALMNENTSGVSSPPPSPPQQAQVTASLVSLPPVEVASPPPNNAIMTLEIDCSGLPDQDGQDDEFDLVSDDEENNNNAADGATEFLHSSSSGGAGDTSTSLINSRCSSYYNPYDEVESKTPKGNNGGRISRLDSTASSKGGDEPDISLSNLSTLTPRPPQEIAALKRTFEGGCYTLPHNDRPDLPAARLPTVQERIEARTQELGAFFSNNDGSTKYSTTQCDPSVVEGKGLLLPHVGYYNEPMPAVVFKKTVPKHRAWFLESIAQVWACLVAGKYSRALRYMDQIELQATIQRLSYTNGLAKVFVTKLRDLVLLEHDKRNFFRLLKESGDIEGYQDLFRREVGVDPQSNNTSHSNSLNATPRGRSSVANNGGGLLGGSIVKMNLPCPILAPGDSKTPRNASSSSELGQGRSSFVHSGSGAVTPAYSAENSRTSSSLPPGEVVFDEDATTGGLASLSSTHALRQVQLADFIKRQLWVEVRYSLLCLECLIARSLKGASQENVWTPPARFPYDG